MSERISVIVPVYGDGAGLDELADRLAAVLDPIASWELILVNDGSPVATWRHIERLAATRSIIKAIDLRANAGQHQALLAGIRASSGATIVTMDDDLQHPPEVLPALLQRLRGSGADLVYGTPSVGVHGRGRRIGGTLIRGLIAWVSGVPPVRHVSALRAFAGTLRPAFATIGGPHVFIDGVLCRHSDAVAMVSVRHEPRRHGQSGYGMRRLAVTAAAMATAFGVRRRRVIELSAASIVTLAVGAWMWRGAGSPPAGVAAALVMGVGGLLAAAGLACAWLRQRGAVGQGPGLGYVIRATINLEPR